MSKLTDFVEQMTAIRNKMQSDGKAALHEAFLEFFENNPTARAISWDQHTPYFNDGDACTFTVYELCLHVFRDKVASDVQHLLSGDDDEASTSEDESFAYLIEQIEGTSFNRKYYTGPFRDLSMDEKTLLKNFRELSKACQSLPELLEAVFGDHVEVVATRDGFEVSESNHD